MVRARPVTIAIVTLCVGLLALAVAGCSGVEVDEEASPASTERSEATERTRSSIAAAEGTSPPTIPLGTTTTRAGPGTAGSSSTATSTSPATPSSPTSPTSPAAPTTGGSGGGADQLAGPLGFGQATTGGAGGRTVTVSSPAALAAAAAGDEPAVIEVTGTIALAGMVPIGSNKTVESVTGSAELVGGGLHIGAAENVIVRNLTITGSGGDGIDVEGSTGVWIDHNDLSAAADGALDIGHGSDRITVSWNHFHHQDQTTQVGHSDGNAAQDTGRLRVTYHHNWFDRTAQRNPRVRFGNPVHVVNNYFSGIAGSGVASTAEAGVLVEANAFESVADPFHIGDGVSPAGSLVARDNHMVASGEGRTGGTVAPIPYAYTPDPATVVESLVTSTAGPQRPS